MYAGSILPHDVKKLTLGDKEGSQDDNCGIVYSVLIALIGLSDRERLDKEEKDAVRRRGTLEDEVMLSSGLVKILGNIDGSDHDGVSVGVKNGGLNRASGGCALKREEGGYSKDRLSYSDGSGGSSDQRREGLIEISSTLIGRVFSLSMRGRRMWSCESEWCGTDICSGAYWPGVNLKESPKPIGIGEGRVGMFGENDINGVAKLDITREREREKPDLAIISSFMFRPRVAAQLTLLGVFGAGAAYFFLPDESRSAPTVENASMSPRHFTRATLASSKPTGPNTKLLSLVAPGQKNDLQPPIWSVFVKDDDIQVERPYTPLKGIDEHGRMLFWVKKYPKGEVGRWLHSKGVGDQIEFRGPLSTWAWKEDSTWDEVVMVWPLLDVKNV